MDTTQWIIFVLTIFASGLIQGVSGFGSALVAMPILAGLVGVRTAAPLVALIGLVIEFFLLIRYRHALQVREVWREHLCSSAHSDWRVVSGIGG